MRMFLLFWVWGMSPGSSYRATFLAYFLRQGLITLPRLVSNMGTFCLNFPDP